MRKFAIACALWATSATAQAQCPGLSERLADQDLACVLGEFEELRSLRLRVPLLEERIDVSDAAIAALREAAELGTQSLDAYHGAIESATARAVNAEEELGAWYRSPLLWFGAGMALTLIAGAVIVLAL